MRFPIGPQRVVVALVRARTYCRPQGPRMMGRAPVRASSSSAGACRVRCTRCPRNRSAATRGSARCTAAGRGGVNKPAGPCRRHGRWRSTRRRRSGCRSWASPPRRRTASDRRDRSRTPTSPGHPTNLRRRRSTLRRLVRNSSILTPDLPCRRACAKRPFRAGSRLNGSRGLGCNPSIAAASSWVTRRSRHRQRERSGGGAGSIRLRPPILVTPAQPQ